MPAITTKSTTTNTWEKLRDMPLAIGTEITDELKDGTPITFEIAALDVYGAKKVLVCKDCLKEEHNMNDERTNEGGWSASDMRKYLSSTVLDLLPDDLKAVIVPRTIKQQLDGKVLKCEDQIWLPSMTEMCGPGSWCSDADIDDVHFPLYSTEKSRVKECATHGTWWYWLRSPNATSSAYFGGVTSSGISHSYGATNSYGVAFGFCI